MWPSQSYFVDSLSALRTNSGQRPPTELSPYARILGSGHPLNPPFGDGDEGDGDGGLGGGGGGDLTA